MPHKLFKRHRNPKSQAYLVKLMICTDSCRNRGKNRNSKWTTKKVAASIRNQFNTSTSRRATKPPSRIKRRLRAAKACPSNNRTAELKRASTKTFITTTPTSQSDPSGRRPKMTVRARNINNPRVAICSLRVPRPEFNR